MGEGLREGDGGRLKERRRVGSREGRGEYRRGDGKEEGEVKNGGEEQGWRRERGELQREDAVGKFL